MTSKHFIAIAKAARDVLSLQHVLKDLGRTQGAVYMLDAIVQVMADSNERFDSDRFYDAVGIDRPND